MPIFRADQKLVYYAHVPKCAGSSLEEYVHERFGGMAFLDQTYMSRPPVERWSKTSPQHIDIKSLYKFIKPSFFDHIFTIVRHPVGRLVSAYHFQLEVERLVPESTGFSEWLLDIEERMAEEPFLFDNHVLPMAQIVPHEATVFHLEHGLDALIPYFDALAGNAEGARAIGRTNERKADKGMRATPSNSDLALIEKIYAEDFERFGYDIADSTPKAAAPELSVEVLADRDRTLARQARPIAKFAMRVARRLNR